MHVLLIALGLLLLQGPTLLHLLVVPHTTCEHGELVEGARVRAGHEAATTDRAGPAVERGQTERADHEHCDATAVRTQVPEVGVVVPCASLAWIVTAEVPGERAEVRPVPLLSLAPKSSPPV